MKMRIDWSSLGQESSFFVGKFHVPQHGTRINGEFQNVHNAFVELIIVDIF